MTRSDPVAWTLRLLCAFSAMLVFTFGAAPAGAEIYRCVGADGSVRFTSRADACPDAQAHQPKGAIQQVPNVTRPASGPPGRPP